METVIVSNNLDVWAFLKEHAELIHFSDYIASETYLQSRSFRVINLCDNYAHQSIGYYVSLLAQARDHKSFPSVDSIQDILSHSLSRFISHDVEEEIQRSLQGIKGDTFILSVYFGQNMAKSHADLARKLHGLFPIPLLRFTLEKRKIWQIKHCDVLTINDIPAHHQVFLEEAATAYLAKKRIQHWRKKQRYHDLAILIDSHEEQAPSNKKALQYFIQAGESLGLNVDLIEKSDAKIIAEYDALFIRATTAVNHYTFRIARRAEQENMVVIDDPKSIIKCCNKVYLAELMRSHQILTPQTLLVSKFDVPDLSKLTYPCVLKKPDSAFSHGVLKIDDVDCLHKSLTQFFKTSDLVLLQPFIPTEFDWRIGVLDNKPIYACKYYMANNHWQIYNWDAPNGTVEGPSAAIPLAEVPEGVIKAALKSTRLIGDGLYGVDLKSFNNQHYVIEVNDNPSVDHGNEDKLLGEQLYNQIMQVFLQRIRRKHGYA